MLIAVAAISYSAVQDRSFVIKGGQNQIFRLPTLGAADTIITSQTVTYTVENKQAYAQHQVFSFDLTAVSGSPSITITAYGRVTNTSAWVQIGTPITWTSNSNDGDISSTSPINYNYLKVTFVASGATQKALIKSFRVKTSNAAQIPDTGGTLVISRVDSGTLTLTSADDDSDAALIVAAGGSGALTLGDANSTTAITSSDWAIGTTGIMTGIGAITSNGLITGTAGATLNGAAINLNASSNFATNIGTGSTNAAVTVGGNSNTVEVNSSSWDISTAGAATGFSSLSVSGLITGGFTLPTPITNTDGTETLTWSQSGKVIVATKSDGATTISLPDPAAGAVGAIYYILQTADQNLVLNCATGDSNAFVCDGVATSDAITISTSDHKIGAGMIVIGISATKYWVGGLNPESVLTPEAAD